MIDRTQILAYAQDIGPDIITVGKITGDYFAATMGNVLSFEMAKQSPGKLWNDATANHPAIYRALRIDKADPAAFYAAFPFRLAKIDGHHNIVAAFPPPPIASPSFEVWTHLDIAFVIAWNPVTNQYHLVGDPQAQVIMPALGASSETLYGDFFAFARHWVERRASFYQTRQDQQKDRWAHPVKEPADGNIPGILAIGDPAKCRWPLSDLPELLTCIGIDRNAVNSAIFKQTKLPRVVEQKMRVAA